MSTDPVVSVVTVNTGPAASVQVTQNTSSTPSVNIQSSGSFAVNRNAFPTNDVVTNVGVPGPQGSQGATGAMPSDYVASVNGVTGALTGFAKTNIAQIFTAPQSFSAGISASGITASTLKHLQELIVGAGSVDNFTGIQFVPFANTIYFYGSPSFDSSFFAPGVNGYTLDITTTQNNDIPNSGIGFGINRAEGMVVNVTAATEQPIFQSSTLGGWACTFTINALGKTAGDDIPNPSQQPSRTQLTQIHALQNPVTGTVTTTTLVNMVTPVGATTVQSYSVVKNGLDQFVLNATKSSQCNEVRYVVKADLFSVNNI